MLRNKDSRIFLVRIIILVAVILLLSLRFKLAIVSGTSMEPTLNSGDVLLVDGRVGVQRGTIVALEWDEGDEFICKRVIGLEGDKIEIKDGVVYVNSAMLSEPYVSNMDIYSDYDCIVPDNSIYFLGDNRLVSMDSRLLGCFSTDTVIGVMILNITESTGLTTKSLPIVWFVIVSIFVCIEVYLYARATRKSKQSCDENEC